MSKKQEYKSMLDGDEYDFIVPESNEENKKSSSSLSRRTKLIIVLAAFVAVMIPVYLLVIAPMLTKTGPGSTKPTLPECHYTEVIYNGRELCMMPSLSEKDIDKVVVKNKVDGPDGTSEYQTWEIFYDSTAKLWGISDYKSSSYDETSLMTIMWYFASMRTQDRIEFSSKDEINMKAYGFDEESMPVHYEIHTTSGKVYSVTMGNKTATGSGYYAYYTNENGEMRPTVYMISNAYGSLINCSVCDLIAPTVTQMLDQANYVPEYFEISKGAEEYFHIKKLSNEEIQKFETAKVSHLYTTIAGKDYEYDASAYYSTMLYDKLQKGINGTKVVYAKPDSVKETPREVLEKYGIDSEKPYIQLYFIANAMYSTNQSHRTQQWVQFSEKTKNANGVDIYYAYNIAYNVISEVPASSVDFIEFDISKFCEQYIFLIPFYSVDTLTIDSSALTDAYVNSGLKRVNETFAFDVRDQKLHGVTLASTGKPVKDVSATLTGASNFSRLYSITLSLSTQFEVPEGVLEKIDFTKPDITLKVVTKNGNTHEMCFYLYNSRHAFYTLDGAGRSYVKYDDISRFLNAAKDVLEGNEIKVGYTSGSSDHNIKPNDNTKEDQIDSSAIGLLIIILVVVVIAAAIVIVMTLLKVRKEKAAREAKEAKEGNKK